MTYLTVRRNVLDCKKRHYKISDFRAEIQTLFASCSKIIIDMCSYYICVERNKFFNERAFKATYLFLIFLLNTL